MVCGSLKLTCICSSRTSAFFKFPKFWLFKSWYFLKDFDNITRQMRSVLLTESASWFAPLTGSADYRNDGSGVLQIPEFEVLGSS